MTYIANARLRAIFLVIALTMSAFLAPGDVARAAGTLTPNGGQWRAGLNAAVWQNDSSAAVPASTVAGAAASASALRADALWLYQGGSWLYYLSSVPSVSTLASLPSVASLFVVLSAPSSDPAGPPTATTVVSGLNVPWSLVFAPDGRWFVSERPGLIRVIENGTLSPTPLADLRGSVSATGEGGLLGLALHPNFASNGWLYAYYSYSGGGVLNRVVRLTVQGNTNVGTPEMILDGIPGSSIHNGGRIAFGPDGKLYITAGDASNSSLAQNLSSWGGKILRINDDGTIPSDGPFPGSIVYTYGHRNPQGIDWQPGTGQLYVTEHGPTGDDEVNRIIAGSNYGWPTVTGIAGDPRFVDAIAEYTPSIAPSGASFYNASLLPCWNGDFFFATLVGQHLHRIRLNSAGGVASEERLFDGTYGRMRDVKVGPDGYLYVLTSNRDGRGTPRTGDDRILRVSVTCR